MATGAVLSFQLPMEALSAMLQILFMTMIVTKLKIKMWITLNHSSSRRELSSCRQTTRTRSQRIRNNNSSSSSSRVTARWTRTTRRRGTSSMRITTTVAGTTTNRGKISNCLWLHSSLDRYSYKILPRKHDSQDLVMSLAL
jgi:hypothetical protein